MPNYDDALRAVLKIHGPTRLAALLGIVPGAVGQWRRVPAHHAPVVEEVTGIPCEVLRPDIYTRPGRAP